MRGRATMLVLLLLGASACRSKQTAVAGAVAEVPASSTLPLDRLAPDELAASDASVWGFAVPRGMRLEAQFSDAAHIVGSVAVEALVDYVRQRVIVGRVELSPERSLFPGARIRGGSSDRSYDLEISRRGSVVRLVIRDVTSKPTVQGLTEAERWRRAGLSPDGKQLGTQELR